MIASVVLMICLPLLIVITSLLVINFYLKCDEDKECVYDNFPVPTLTPTPTPIEQSKVKVEPKQTVIDINNKGKKTTKKAKTSKKKKK